MADFDPTFMLQVFDIPQRKRKPDVEHHGQTDDLRRVGVGPDLTPLLVRPRQDTDGPIQRVFIFVNSRIP